MAGVAAGRAAVHAVGPPIACLAIAFEGAARPLIWAFRGSWSRDCSTIAAICGLWAHSAPAWAQERAVRLVALGDSLTTGLGLPANAAFPVKLTAALKGRGIAAEVADAGVSGDTAANGLARLDWAVPDANRWRDPGARRQRHAARDRSGGDPPGA